MYDAPQLFPVKRAPGGCSELSQAEVSFISSHNHRG